MDHDTNLKSGDCVISNSCPVAFLLFPLTTAYKKVTLRDYLSTVFGPKKCISSDESASFTSGKSIVRIDLPADFLREVTVKKRHPITVPEVQSCRGPTDEPPELPWSLPARSQHPP